MDAVLRLLSRRGEPSRRTRRILVVLSVVAIVAVGFTMLEAPSARERLPLMILIAIVATVPLYAVSEFRRNVLRRGDADERERARANEAYRTSYRIVEIGLLSIALVFAFAEWFESLPGWDWFVVWIVGIWLVIFLPYFVFAWREPDAVVD